MSPEFFRVQEHVIPAQHIREYAGATAHTQEEELQLHVKQYTPLDSESLSSDAITIIGAHANGVPKVFLSANKQLQKELIMYRSFMSLYGMRSTDDPKTTDSLSEQYGSQMLPIRVSALC